MLPLGLYSHADQRAVNESDRISMNISLSRTNIFQSGKTIIPYSITPDGVSLLDGYADPQRLFLRRAVDSMLEQRYQNLIKPTYADITRTSIESAGVFRTAWNNAPAIATRFAATQLGRTLAGVAKSIAARDHLGMRRQTCFVRRGPYPLDLSLGNDLDTGRGRLIPTTSAVVYFAELVRWLGVPRSELSRVLPNLGRFHDASNTNPPLGLWS